MQVATASPIKNFLGEFWKLLGCFWKQIMKRNLRKKPCIACVYQIMIRNGFFTKHML